MTVVKLAALAGVGIVPVAFYGAAVEFGIFVLEAANAQPAHLLVGSYVVLGERPAQEEDVDPQSQDTERDEREYGEQIRPHGLPGISGRSPG